MSFYQATQNQRSGTGGGFLGALNRDTTQESKGFYAAVNSPAKSTDDLSSVDGLVKLAREKGLLGADEIADKDKLSFLQRLSVGLGALNPAEAIARNYEGTESFLTAYPTTVVQGIVSAFTGNDYGEQTKKRYFGDVLDMMGVENKYERFGLGLVGDIFLDPSTYFGGTIVRAGAKGVSFAGRAGMKGVEAISPEAAKSLRVAGGALKDAGGELFVYGYGASKIKKTGEAGGLAEDFLEYEGKKVNVQKNLAIANAKKFGNDVLTDKQWEEMLGYMFKGKSAEFNYFDQVTDEMLDAFNTQFPNARFPLKDIKSMKETLSKNLGREASDIEVRNAIRSQTTGRLESLSVKVPEKIGRLQELRTRLAQPFIADDLLGLKGTVAELRKELSEMTEKKVVEKVKGKPFMATPEQMDNALLDALSMEKGKYKKMILDLEARIAGIESGVIDPAMRQVTKEVANKSAKFTIEDIMQQALRKLDPSLKVKDEIVKITQQITDLTNEMLQKQHILENVLSGKQIAKDRITKAFATGDFSMLPEELVSAMRPAIRARGMETIRVKGAAPVQNVENIVKQQPNLNLKRDVTVTDIYGNKAIIPEDEALSAYELRGGKVLLKDGKEYIVTKSQYENIKNNSLRAEAQPFAPELTGTEEIVRGEISPYQIYSDELRKKYGLKPHETLSPEKLTDAEDKMLDKLLKETPSETKFSPYQVAGGENYKETIHKIKEFPVESDTSHFDDAASWHRSNERIYKGKKTYFLEEIQKNKNLDKVEGHPLGKGKYVKAEIKSALQEAETSGSEYFAWTTGEQQTARYNLAKEVDNIHWNEAAQWEPKGSKNIAAQTKKGEKSFTISVDETGKILRGGGGAEGQIGKQLSDVIGKGLSEKILTEKTGTLAGEGLNIGGEWANTLYDKQIKNIIEDITGKKVEIIDMELPIGDATRMYHVKSTTLKSGLELTESGSELAVHQLSAGKLIADENDNFYKITKVLKDGKFEAISKEDADLYAQMKKSGESDRRIKELSEQSVKEFDISNPKSAGQQAIKLTPEVKAKIRGEAPTLKIPSGAAPFAGAEGLGTKTEAVGAITDDVAVEKALADRLKRNAEVASAAGIDDPFIMYAPSVAKEIPERQRLTNFFNGTKGVKVGSKDYTKEFRNLLKDEELVKDRTLFLHVEDEIATNKLTEEFLQKTIGDYGMPLTAFKTEREATAAGYRILKDKGIFGKEVGYVTEADWKFLNGQMGNNYGAFDKIAKATGFDVATSLFKRFVTGPFAPFHVRNLASGEMQNFELIGKVAQSPKVQAGGIRIANKISQGAFLSLEDPFDAAVAIGKKVKSFGEETIELHGKAWKLDEIGQAIEHRFGGSSRYNVEYNSITSDADKLLGSGTFSKEALKEWGKSFTKAQLKKNPIEGLIGENNPIFRGARVVGAWIEMQQKSKLVLGALEKGMTMNEALMIAAKGGFDYRALTAFESKIMRRIIPFYSFNRKNIELQLHVLKTNPQRINQIIRSIENVQNLWETNLTDEEKENLPAYLKEYLSVPVGRSNQGVPQFVRSFGTPIEAFTELFKFSVEGKSTIERTLLGTLSKVNPYIKVPIELGIGKDSFRQRDIKEVYTAPEYEIAPQFLKDYLQLREITKKDFITGLPRTTYVADPERLLVVRSLFTSRGFTYFSNIFNGNIQGFFKVMDLLSGIRVAEVDVERQAGFTERRKIEELGDLLRRNGVLSEFNKLFIPKQK